MTTAPNPAIDEYMLNGCGRCKYYATPQCKVVPWRTVLEHLRQLMLTTGLVEEKKWGVPTYTHQGKNIVTLGALKESVVLSFFKGVLLPDPEGLLENPGQNSHIGRYLRFKSLEEVEQRAEYALALIQHALQLEASGQTKVPSREPDPVPEELATALAEDATLAAAYYALTPGRQRSYILHIAQAKQTQTRKDRVQKCAPYILKGLGFHEW